MTKGQNTNVLIGSAVTTTATAGFFDPTPGGADVPVLIASWVGMLGGIAKIYEVPFDTNLAKNTLTQALTSAAFFIGGTKALTFLLKWTGAGFVVGGGINAFLNAVFTWRVGRLYQATWMKGSEPPTAKQVAQALMVMIGLEEIGEVTAMMRSSSTDDSA